MDEAERVPPAEAESLTADGLLRKLILRQGAGDVPAMHSRCLVHYVGRLAETGEVFMDTREESRNQEPQQLVAGRDTAYQEGGLHLAVATMRRGELCRLWVAPQYGYGEKGSFSFPTVPPSADLVYELELLDFDPPDEGRDTAGMTFEERLEAGERRRLEGNDAFNAGRLDEALRKYRLALSYVNEDMLVQLGEFHLAKAMELKRPLLLNAAACQLRLGDLHGAVATCSEVLAEQPGNAKALFRRGRARRELGQSQAALADLEAAAAAAPGDAAVARELAAVRREVKQERQASGRVFKGFFEKAKAAGEELYAEGPPPPATPEASLAASPPRPATWPLLHSHAWLRSAVAVAALAALAWWCWAAVRPRVAA